MTVEAKRANRYWGDQAPPTSKLEFFNAVTTPAPAGDGAIATIRMYGPIDSYGGFWGISTKDVGAVLDELPDTVTQIIVRINSRGGEVFEAAAILNMLRAHKATTTAVVDGLAASAASVIASGCDETVMSPGTQMMIHSPSVITWGNATDLRKVADVLDSIETSIIDIYSAKAGEKDWPALLAEETWMTAKETVTMGLADRVAVIPDAGETETVGADPIVIVTTEDDDAEDAVRLRPVAAAEFVASQKPPVSTEPGATIRKENVVAYDDLKAGLVKRLGVTDAAASDDTLLAALDQALEEQPDNTARVQVSLETLPEGVQLIDSEVLAELQAQAAQGVEARAEQTRTRRGGILSAALADGRIAPASREKWAALLDKDEQGTSEVLDSLPKNAVPVDEIGHATVKSEDERLTAAAGWDDENEEA